ncbi:MAG: hypothetical protein ACOH2N_06965 [Devosia sp.]
MTPANDEPYDLTQHHLARDLGHRLAEMSGKLTGVMSDHGIATSFISIGLQAAIRQHGTQGAADWLRQVADAVESGKVTDSEHIVN